MRFGRLFTLLHIRSRHERLMKRDLKDALERIHRLEIAKEQSDDDMEHLKARLAKLGTRLGGALGGRPRAGSQGALALEEIPLGDKAALRKYYQSNPPAKEKQ